MITATALISITLPLCKVLQFAKGDLNKTVETS
jgi:hypothetical protein